MSFSQSNAKLLLRQRSAQMQKSTKRILNKYYLALFVVLAFSYLLASIVSGRINSISNFTTQFVMDTAQVARNTINGHFFTTNYILPVGYAYFPTFVNHPDFIRYPLPVLIYSFLFIVFGQSALYIKLLNALLFIFNGALIYKLVLMVQIKETHTEITQSCNRAQQIAFLTAIASSLFALTYFQQALSDGYEVISYTFLLLTLSMALRRRNPPFVFGVLCGLLYLTKPTFALFVFFATLYFLGSRKNFKQWFSDGLLVVLGFSLLVTPFILRSYLLTGEPLFALQQKVDLIKTTWESHDQLYKTFSKPQSVISFVTADLSGYINRWSLRVLDAIKNMFIGENLLAWIGMIPLFLFFKRSRAFFLSYFGFLAVHIIVVANYLAIWDTARIYSILMCVLIVFSFLGIFKTLYFLIEKHSKTVVSLKVFVSTSFLLVLISALLAFTGVLPKENSNGIIDFPDGVKQTINDLSPACIYTNSPYRTAWFLDVPSLYTTNNPSEMVTDGPRDCQYFVQVGDVNELLTVFVKEHSELIYSEDLFSIYKLKFDLK
jgi:hypothetical protein